jgi:hypothetical protein
MQALDPTTAWHLATEQERELVREGDPLLEAAARLQEQLPAGPVHLLTRNAESAAVVGAALAMLSPRGTAASWQPLMLRRREELSGRGRPVLVEVAELGDGLRQMIAERYPGMLVIDQLAGTSRSRPQLERAA